MKHCIKNAGEKCTDLNLVLCRFLMDYRNTVHSTTGKSPAMLMLGRQIRNRFDLLKPEEKVGKNVSDYVNKQQKIQIRNYRGNRTTEFQKGKIVAVKDYRNVNRVSWIKGIIKEKVGKRTYLVWVPEIQRVWRRHLNQIRNYDDYYPKIMNSSDRNDSVPEYTENVNKNSVSEAELPNNEIVNRPLESNTEPDSENMQRRSNRERREPERFGYD